MKLHVNFGVLLLAAIASARFQPQIGESNISSGSDLSKIINGHPASEGQYPYMVLIEGWHYCGGVLISPSWVLTEALCVVERGVTVYLGSADMTRPLLMIVTEDIRPHPLFDSFPSRFNIALINLMHSVAYTETIGPIALPRQSQEYPDFGSGRTATILGWGSTEQEGDGMNILHYGTVAIIPNDECQLPNGDPAFDTHICAVPTGEILQNVCTYDWGGPLVLHDMDDNIDIVAGILSATTYPNCVSERPSIFIRPQLFLDWIFNESGLPIRP